MRRFWNQIFTCRSVRLSIRDSCMRFSLLMYTLKKNSRSSSRIWYLEYGHLFLRVLCPSGKQEKKEKKSGHRKYKHFKLAMTMFKKKRFNRFGCSQDYARADFLYIKHICHYNISSVIFGLERWQNHWLAGQHTWAMTFSNKWKQHAHFQISAAHSNRSRFLWKWLVL